MSDGMYRWFDHKGGIIVAPATEGRPTCFGTFDRLNHWMFGEPSSQARFQAMTLCGKRAHEVPGRGEVDCPECIEALGEPPPVVSPGVIATDLLARSILGSGVDTHG